MYLVWSPLFPSLNPLVLSFRGTEGFPTHSISGLWWKKSSLYSFLAMHLFCQDQSKLTTEHGQCESIVREYGMISHLWLLWKKEKSAALGIRHDWGWKNGLEWIKMRQIRKILWLLLHLSKTHVGPITSIFAMRVCEFWENMQVKGLVWLGWKTPLF